MSPPITSATQVIFSLPRHACLLIRHTVVQRKRSPLVYSWTFAKEKEQRSKVTRAEERKGMRKLVLCEMTNDVHKSRARACSGQRENDVIDPWRPSPIDKPCRLGRVNDTLRRDQPGGCVFFQHQAGLGVGQGPACIGGGRQ
jgi:hypothetical protein